ncbi:muconolactone delta-isomerase [Burkholderia multivorans]|nr:muconolactone delta-isomerase [Burkholderia multivorans]
MLYLVRMDVTLPEGVSPEERAGLLAREKAYSQDLQRDGRCKEISRIVGEYANYSVFDVADRDELPGLLSGLPLFPHMRISVTPLATHPSHI